MRAAVLRWMTPLVTALSRVRIAWSTAACASLPGVVTEARAFLSAVRSKVRSAIKDARASQGAEMSTTVVEAIRELDRAVSKGVIHRNTAARKKSALARRLAAAR